MQSLSILRFGTEVPSDDIVPLNAGTLTLLFEKSTGFLRNIRMGDHEIVRCIYAALRDPEWKNVRPVLSGLQIEKDATRFRITFNAVCQRDSIDFRWHGVLTGTPEGTISFEFDGTAESDFRRNRIGICVLHPILECAGKPCSIEKPDGSLEPGVFPETISPHQPFRQIRAISHEPIPGVRAEVRFEGDVFEMEDQRNWTDASFKTYSTPLEIPFPADVPKGTRIQQKATLSVPAPARKILSVNLGRGAQLSISTTPVLGKPRIGLCTATHGNPLSEREMERLKALNLSHLRIDTHFAAPDWTDRFKMAARESTALGVPLQAALILGDNPESELDEFIALCKSLQATISLWLIFQESQPSAPESLIRLAKQKLAPLGPNILVAAGADRFFTELNRNRPAADSQALPCFPLTPQAHAIDSMTMVENLAAQIHTVDTAQTFAPRATVISPVTLRPRRTAGTTIEGTTHPDQLPDWVDPRQMSLFGASWTLGSIARMALSTKIHSLTYFETTGWTGIMEEENGCPLPGLFPSIPGTVFPVYHLLADLADCNRLYPTHSSHPLQLEAITLLDSKNRRRILVANLLGETQEIKIKTGTCQARVRYLDETTAMEAMQSPEAFRSREGDLLESAAGKLSLNLLPCALARVDIL